MNDSLLNMDKSCNRLSKIAEEYRQKLPIDNFYTKDNQFSETSPRATQEKDSKDSLNIHGKGTGTYLDTANGGGYYDINGKPELQNTGRNAIYTKNQYTKNNPYDCFI